MQLSDTRELRRIVSFILIYDVQKRGKLRSFLFLRPRVKDEIGPFLILEGILMRGTGRTRAGLFYGHPCILELFYERCKVHRIPRSAVNNEPFNKL